MLNTLTPSKLLFFFSVVSFPPSLAVPPFPLYSSRLLPALSKRKCTAFSASTNCHAMIFTFSITLHLHTKNEKIWQSETFTLRDLHSRSDICIKESNLSRFSHTPPSFERFQHNHGQSYSTQSERELPNRC